MRLTPFFMGGDALMSYRYTIEQDGALLAIRPSAIEGSVDMQHDCVFHGCEHTEMEYMAMREREEVLTRGMIWCHAGAQPAWGQPMYGRFILNAFRWIPDR